jgi:hypothetical protein
VSDLLHSKEAVPEAREINGLNLVGQSALVCWLFVSGLLTASPSRFSIVLLLSDAN